MDHSHHSSPSILVIIGSSALFARHRLSDPVFVVCAASRAPDIETVVKHAKVVTPIGPRTLALPYRRTLALTNGSTQRSHA